MGDRVAATDIPEPPVSRGDLPRVKLLLVDDHPEQLLVLESILSELGQELVRAGSGREALRQCLNHDFALILMDVNMPGMDGFAATRALRGDSATKDIPVVLVTAKDQKADKAWGQMLGAKGYVTKPFSDEQLLSQVRAL